MQAPLAFMRDREEDEEIIMCTRVVFNNAGTKVGTALDRHKEGHQSGPMEECEAACQSPLQFSGVSGVGECADRAVWWTDLTYECVSTCPCLAALRQKKSRWERA